MPIGQPASSSEEWRRTPEEQPGACLQGGRSGGLRFQRRSDAHSPELMGALLHFRRRALVSAAVCFLVRDVCKARADTACAPGCPPTRVPRPPTLVQHFTASLSRRLVGVRLGRYVYVRCPARARLLWRRPCVVQPAPRTFLLGKLRTGCAATVQLPGCQPSDSACSPAISSFPPRPPAPAVPAAEHDVCYDGGPKHVCDGPFCAGQ